MQAEPIVCGGRTVTDDLAVTGDACGRTLKALSWETRPAQLAERARAAGWSVAGPAPMCPRCRRPDPAIVRGLAPAR